MSKTYDRLLSQDDKYPDLKYRRIIRQFAENDRNADKLSSVFHYIGLQYGQGSLADAIIRFSYQENNIETLRNVSLYIQTLQAKS